MKKILIVVVFSMFFAEANEISEVKDLYIDAQRTITMDKLLANREICQSYNWSSAKDRLGRVTVKYECLFKLPKGYIKDKRTKYVENKEMDYKISIESINTLIEREEQRVEEETQNNNKKIHILNDLLETINEDNALDLYNKWGDELAAYNRFYNNDSNNNSEYIFQVLRTHDNGLSDLSSKLFLNNHSMRSRSIYETDTERQERLEQERLEDIQIQENNKKYSSQLYEIFNKAFNQEMAILKGKNFTCDKSDYMSYCHDLNELKEKKDAYQNAIHQIEAVANKRYPSDLKIVEILEWNVNSYGQIFFLKGEITEYVSDNDSQRLLAYSNQTYLEYILGQIDKSNIDEYLNEYGLYVFGKVIVLPALSQ